ncbi:MAG: hypothetical protein ACTSPB_22055, partial [Candidatus Thorarchaeota archaeon]
KTEVAVMCGFGIGKKEKELEQNDDRPALGQRQSEKDIVGEIAGAMVTKGAPAEPILSRFAEYPNMVFPEFRRVARMLLHPANLMGYRSHSEIADIINELEYMGLKYRCKPAGVRSDKYRRFKLFMTNTEGLLNLSVNGKLIQAQTRFLFPETLATLKRAKDKEYYEGDER